MEEWKEQLLHWYHEYKKEFPQQRIIYIKVEDLHKLHIASEGYNVIVSKLYAKIRGIMTRRELNMQRLKE